MKPFINEQLEQRLVELAKRNQQQGIKPKFSVRADRVENYSIDLHDICFDFSKTHIDEELLNAYLELADNAGVRIKTQDFLSGVAINATEQRSVLHTLLRDSSNQGIEMVDAALINEAELVRQQLVENLAAITRQLEERENKITDVIHVGIGGSSLGTQLLYQALKGLEDSRKIHFIGNIDAHQLVDVLNQCDPLTTLVIGVSKTFTTAETLKNLDSIARWYLDSNIENPLQYFYGVTANESAAIAYGLNIENIVTFPNWVGGRYSVWSSVSLSAALLLGADKFDEFLSGAALMDQHFYQTPLETNVCFLAASLDHFYANYMNISSKAIFAYDYRFRSLVDYLQQLETESNGKDRHRDGSPTRCKTSMVVWGGIGTEVQHSVFQMLHQGTSLIPAEFILVARPDHDYADHHKELLANGIAQSAALLAGQDKETVERLHASDDLSELAMNAKVFSGDRPSTTILLNQLTPASLGALLAFYEHRVFFGGLLSDINSFDQMGVELGKRLANEVEPLIENAKISNTSFDPSTESLLKKITS